MNALLLMLICGIGYLVAYYTYGRWLATKIFQIRPDNPVPSRQFQDGIDYVPSRKGVIFGHHFTSIAGTGPIVGPAIGLIWGWLPAILWVTVGCIFMGAVHDFGALVVSLRNEGKSISEIAARYINRRVRLLFFFIVFLVLLVVIAIFGIIIATVFGMYPACVIPTWLQIPIAIALGWAVYRKNANIMLSTALAVIAMYLTVALGAWLENHYPGLSQLPVIGDMPATGSWTIILLIYCSFASTLPVTLLLQPRDYINAWQLFLMMGLLMVSIVVAAFSSETFTLSAPMINQQVPADVPPMMPMMFVLIACGAISGFHALVSSGTSPKQISRETDSLFIGFGSMLLEGMLAVLVIICIAAGLGMGHDGMTGRAAWDSFYTGWMEGRGLQNNLQPVAIGAANIMHSIGIPTSMGLAIFGVFVCSFAGTTLDTTVRIQRYVIAEIAEDLKLPAMAGRYKATLFAVLTGAALAFLDTTGGKIAFGADAKGALRLWPILGTVNQLLAAVALLVITMYLRKKGGLKYLITAIPCMIILFITSYAMILNEITYYRQQNWLLAGLSGVIFVMAVWMTIETIIQFAKKQNDNSDIS
jgi:carbon starvation protein